MWCESVFIKTCSTSTSAKNCLIEIKNTLHATRHSGYEAADEWRRNQRGEIIMLVSGVVATASLIGILVALLGAATVLMLVDKHFDANREH